MQSLKQCNMLSINITSAASSNNIIRTSPFQKNDFNLISKLKIILRSSITHKCFNINPQVIIISHSSMKTFQRAIANQIWQNCYIISMRNCIAIGKNCLRLVILKPNIVNRTRTVCISIFTLMAQPIATNLIVNKFRVKINRCNTVA